MWKKLLNINKAPEIPNPMTSGGEIIDVLDQLRSELVISNLNIKKELHQLTKYFNKIPLPYAIIGYDRTLIRANVSLLKFLSCVKSECIGVDIMKYIHPDDIDMFIIYINNKKNDDNSDSDSDDNEIIIRILNAKGCVTYIKWGVVNLPNDQMMMLFGQDITHELKLSDELHSLILNKNRILNTYPGSVMSIDTKGIIIDFNTTAEVQSGYKSNEILGKSHVFEIFPDKNLFHIDRVEHIQKTNLRKKSGELELSYILFIPLKNENDILVGYLGIWHNEEYLNYVKSID